MSYGTAMKLLREASGFSQRKLARVVDLEPSYLSHIEHDRKKPSLEVLEQICRVLDVPVPVFFVLATDRSLASRVSDL